MEHLWALVEMCCVSFVWRDLCTDEAVNFQHSNLEVARCTKRRVVEGFTCIRLAKSDVLVHPNCLAIAKKECQWVNAQEMFHCLFAFTLLQLLSFYCRQPWTALMRGPHSGRFQFPPKEIWRVQGTARRGMFLQFQSMFVSDLCRL